ncbi:MAG: SpoIIE family protein phosphatase [Armatimonadetes bacterium]|nr:SpoIIE family protein phosphatase [Armatimonadota bacterium]
MIPRSPSHPVQRYVVAGIAFLCALGINALIQKESPFVLFLAIVLVSAWYGGLGPGLAATAVSAIASDYFFLSPKHSLVMPNATDTLRLTLFVVEGIVITLLSEAYKRKEEERAQSEVVQQQLRAVVKRKQDLVQTLSEGFLQQNPQIPGFEAAFFYQPSSRDDMVGGDCFDFFTFDVSLQGVMIGDVCGKGLSAARYTSRTKYMLEAYALEDPTPQTTVTRLNRALAKELGEAAMFVSLIYGVLDSEAATFTYTNAGHPQPILYDPGAERFVRLEVTGGVIGADPGMEFRQTTVSLPPGSVLLFFTDGLMEAVGCDDPDGDGNVSPIMKERAGEGAEAVAWTIFDRARRLADRNRRDDMAVIAIRRTETLSKALSDESESSCKAVA